jgi:hypothetical protein
MSQTNPQSRRHWFRFGTRAMLAAITLIAVGLWYCSDWLTGYPNEFEEVFSGPEDIQRQVVQDLNSNGIECHSRTGKGYHVSVARRNYRRASEIISNASYFDEREMSVWNEIPHQYKYKTVGEIYHDWQVYGLKKALSNL